MITAVINCIDLGYTGADEMSNFRFQGKRKMGEEKGSKVGGNEKANIYHMSSVSKCCDIHVTNVTSSML